MMSAASRVCEYVFMHAFLNEHFQNWIFDHKAHFARPIIISDKSVVLAYLNDNFDFRYIPKINNKRASREFYCIGFVFWLNAIIQQLD